MRMDGEIHLRNFKRFSAIISGLIFLIIVSASGSAFANSDDAAETALDLKNGQINASPCELHFITTDNIQIADSTDFKDGGLVGGLLSGLYRKENPLSAYDLANAEVGPEGQERFLAASLNLLPSQFADYHVAYEHGGNRPLAAFQQAKKTLRLSSSDSPCLAEISVVAVTYVRTSLARRIGYLFMFRQFDGAGSARKVITFANFSPVKAFPPQSEADFPAAREEVKSGFINALGGFMRKIDKEIVSISNK